jgi:hypothetical protein
MFRLLCKNGDMPRDIEIEQAARVVIRTRGSGAVWAAELRARRLSEDGQAGAAAIWRRIAEVIRRLQADETDPSAE